jgi:polyphosphate kinase 2 (PPK2 family)
MKQEAMMKAYLVRAGSTFGKDGAIRSVMSGVNPQGCTVLSFKAPFFL